jgi:hypothetical protein
MLELAITKLVSGFISQTNNQRNKSNGHIYYRAYVRTCVRAEEATYIIRSYIYVVTLYSFIVT